MKTNNIKGLFSSNNKEKVTFRKIKRKYKKPMSTMGFWEAMARTR